MEKEMTLRVKANRVNNLLRAVSATMQSAVSILNSYNSSVLGRQVTSRQSLLLLNAEVAFTACAFGTCSSVGLQLALCAWLLHALKLCKDEM